MMPEKNPWPQIAQDFVKHVEDIWLEYQDILRLLVDPEPPVSPGDPPPPSEEGFGPFGEDCDD